jgi:hypothetical protein
MSSLPQDSIPSLLVRNLPRDLVMAVEDALSQGASRAFRAANGMEDGHLPHVVGQLRHFQMNEAFYRALAANDAAPTPIRGNSLIIGRAGIFALGRFNIPAGFWVNGRRSHTRQQMALANQALEPLVQGALFDQYRPPSGAVAFFVACFSGSLQVSPDAPVSIHIAVPNGDMHGWLFREPLSVFLQRYEPVAGEAQPDLVKPKLKKRSDAAGEGSST